MVARSAKKPRKKKLNPRDIHLPGETAPKKEKDWTFEDVLRSKTRRR